MIGSANFAVNFTQLGMTKGDLSDELGPFRKQVWALQNEVTLLKREWEGIIVSPLPTTPEAAWKVVGKRCRLVANGEQQHISFSTINSSSEFEVEYGKGTRKPDEVTLLGGKILVVGDCQINL